MSNKKNAVVETNIYERLWKLYIMVGKMIMDGVRDPKGVAEILQTIVDEGEVYLKRENEASFGDIRVVIFELIKDATFQLMLGQLGGKRRCWKNTEEASAFAGQNKGKLGPNGNFFELEGDFVACVHLDGAGQPYVYYVYPLSYVSTLYAESQHRVFSLQP